MKQRLTTSWTWRSVALLLFASAAYSGDAWAQNVACSSLPGATYLQGSAAAQSYIAALSAANAGTISYIFQSSDSCVAVSSLITSGRLQGTATYWVAGPSGPVANPCDLDANGTPVDIAVSDVYYTTCPGFSVPLPNGLSEALGPIQVYGFAAPRASTQTAISAEAAYFVFGFGAAAGQVAPWTDDTRVLIRSDQSGIQQLPARIINTNASTWKGVTTPVATIISTFGSATNPDSYIGVLPALFADANRDKVKFLAYRHYKQRYAYWPDSKESLRNKRNVRDGHYPIWGPLHLLAAPPQQITPNVARFLGYFNGNTPLPQGLNLVDLEIAAHTVPQCAMRVQRQSELGNVSAYKPSNPCGCYFEFKNDGATSCRACTSDSNCNANETCSFGYCEAR
ncbi:MAG TPA: hypothetical protein VH877_29280 [Polyangia bacterium]|jgi:hypothetical protein|nr:hypothetical protein [Polyangia bacterium]